MSCHSLGITSREDLVAQSAGGGRQHTACQIPPRLREKTHLSSQAGVALPSLIRKRTLFCSNRQPEHSVCLGRFLFGVCSNLMQRGQVIAFELLKLGTDYAHTNDILACELAL